MVAAGRVAAGRVAAAPMRQAAGRRPADRARSGTAATGGLPAAPSNERPATGPAGTGPAGLRVAPPETEQPGCSATIRSALAADSSGTGWASPEPTGCRSAPAQTAAIRPRVGHLVAHRPRHRPNLVRPPPHPHPHQNQPRQGHLRRPSPKHPSRLRHPRSPRPQPADGVRLCRVVPPCRPARPGPRTNPSRPRQCPLPDVGVRRVPLLLCVGGRLPVPGFRPPLCRTPGSCRSPPRPSSPGAGTKAPSPTP
jgi:hypothetical protein